MIYKSSLDFEVLNICVCFYSFNNLCKSFLSFLFLFFSQILMEIGGCCFNLMAIIVDNKTIFHVMQWLHIHDTEEQYLCDTYFLLLDSCFTKIFCFFCIQLYFYQG